MKNLSSEEITKELGSIASKISELKNELEWMENAPLPKNEVYAQWCKSIDEHTARFKFNPLILDMFKVSGSPAGYGGVTSDLGPLLSALFNEQIKESVKKLLDKSDFEEGPSESERPELIKHLKSELLKLEQRQEELIVRASELGVHVSRPQGFNPAVVLGLDN